ncbi:MAG: 3-isopropylmalate dehydratase small subunit [Hyphomicrobiales bacterium]|nr:3-isopropylmalate dehydratase small subunit [Hyphomicrobiales bacterium]
MTPFGRVKSVAAPLPESDIDTDVIFPARFLLLLDKAGLGKHLFNERRYDRAGKPRPDFILNQPPFETARILVAGQRFGSGSSREQAVWALADFGFACVIAPSFGEIFYTNCFKNGVLAIRMDETSHRALLQASQAGDIVTVDLERQRVSWTSGAVSFDIDAYRRRALLEGLDEIAQTLSDDSGAIDDFEARWSSRAPWVQIEGQHAAPDGGKDTP